MMAQALVLYSGSLASRLALKLAEEIWGLDVGVVYFRSPFFEEHEGLQRAFRELARRLPFRTKTLKREYLRLALGEGGLPFPCGACRRVLLLRAARMARRLRAQYIVTGEVVEKGGLGEGELMRLEAQLGLEGYVIRPLSGRLLPPTRAERRGEWPREALFDLRAGDLRGLQALAGELGLGGDLGQARFCSLSDPVYAGRLLAVLREGLPTVNTLRLLGFRHFFFLPPDLKVVVALEPEEQAVLQTLFLPTDVRLYLPMPRSPLVLARAGWAGYTEEERRRAVVQAAGIALAVAGFPGGETCDVCFRFEWEEETKRLLIVAPKPSELPLQPGDGLIPSPAEVYLTS